LAITAAIQYEIYMQKFRYTKRIVSSEKLRRVALVRTDVSEKSSASFIRVTRIGELGTTLRALVASFS
jgi:hypothetical protein